MRSDLFRSAVYSEYSGLARLPDKILEIAAVVVGELARQVLDLRGRDESHPVGDLLDAGDLEPLPGLDGLDVVGGLDQRLGRAGVEPGEPAAEPLDAELAALEIVAVDVGDLQLAPRRGLQVRGDLDDLVVVEIEPGDGEVRPRPRRLLLDRDGACPCASNSTTP